MSQAGNETVSAKVSAGNPAIELDRIDSLATLAP
jgi:hypothetical protein